jgi:hypothetical protein
LVFRNISWLKADKQCKEKGLELVDFSDRQMVNKTKYTMAFEKQQKGWHSFGQIYYLSLQSKVRYAYLF